MIGLMCGLEAKIVSAILRFLNPTEPEICAAIGVLQTNISLLTLHTFSDGKNGQLPHRLPAFLNLIEN